MIATSVLPRPTRRAGRCLTPFLASLCLAGFSGCSSSKIGEIEGRVLLDGEPAKQLQVMYRRIGGGGDGLGVTGPDGRYVLYHGRGKRDFPVGEYTIAIAPLEAEGGERSKLRLPKTITDPEQSTLKKTVNAGSNVIDLEISSK
jgi:hypothetical protein